MPIRFSAIGRLKDDWEVKHTNQNKMYITNSLAVKNVDFKTTTWINLSEFNENRINIFSQHTHKGSKIFIAGTLKEEIINGTKYNNFYVTDFELLDNKEKQQEVQKDDEIDWDRVNNLGKDNRDYTPQKSIDDDDFFDDLQQQADEEESW